MTSPFVRPRPVDDPAVRVVGFHHAGGSASAYYRMARALPADWDLLLLDMPGRGKQAARPVLETAPAAVAQAVADLEPWLAGAPMALFGHSFGALLAHEAALALERLGRPPVWVGVSGRVPPSHHREVRALSVLDDDALLERMTAMGGMPDQVAAVPELVRRFLPVTRADLRAVESYRPSAAREPLSCPVTVFCGDQDAFAPLPAMADWAAETRHPLRRLVFPGGHFYFTGTALDGFAAALFDEIRTVVPQAA